MCTNIIISFIYVIVISDMFATRMFFHSEVVCEYQGTMQNLDPAQIEQLAEDFK